jgi:hypothetical protein
MNAGGQQRLWIGAPPPFLPPDGDYPVAPVTVWIVTADAKFIAKRQGAALSYF